MSKNKKILVVLTGAGISAESGLKTFRDSDGLWEGYNIQEVATFDAWKRNPVLVQQFYNERRKAVHNAQPNAAHIALAELEESYNVRIITQNIDNLHERAGSTKILHLHGEITKSRSTFDPELIYDIEGPDLKMGDKCEKGSQLRPHIVWFGEDVPAMEEAIMITKAADIFVVIGTSLVVYPAASLVDFVPSWAPIYLIDPKANQVSTSSRVVKIPKIATTGMIDLISQLKLF